MTLVREAGSQVISNFTVPYRGTWRSVAANQLTPDALYNSNNVFIREGKLRERPGLSLLNNTVFTTPIIGGSMAVTPTTKILLAITRSTLYTLSPSATSWIIDTATSFAANDDNIIDITFLETANQYVAVIANNSTTLKRWIQGSGAAPITAVNGTVPAAKSVCTAARRIIFLVEPHTVGWTATLTYDNFPALAFAKIAATNDLGICVKSLSTLAFAVYKERSIYVARAQAGTDASAFGFNEPIIVEGPAGVHAVVNINGTHIYMTQNGRIAIFNGSAYPEWIADGLWLYLQSDIDATYAYKIFGVFDYRLHTVSFHYPRLSDSNGRMTGLVIVNLPLEGSGVDKYASFLGTVSKPCSYGYEMRFNQQIDRSILFTSTAGDNKSFIFNEDANTDDNVPYACLFQTPLIPMPDMKYSQVSVESFLERADGNGIVTVYSVTSDMLESKTGTKQLSAYNIIDLNDNPVSEYVGFNVPTRFFSLQYEWLSTSKVRYAGAAVYGRVVT